jgi:uncharacterized lipoprotein YmbA
MTSHQQGAALVLAAALAGAGCSTPVDRYHTLRPASAAPANTARTVAKVLTIGPVTIPEALDREGWVVRTGDTTVHVYQHQLWTQGLASEITQTLADQVNVALATAGGSPGADGVWADGSPANPSVDPTVVLPHALRVRVQVLRFDSVLAPATGISDELRWTLECTSGESATDPALLRFHVLRTALREVTAPADGTADGGGDDSAVRFDRLARAHAQALQAVAQDIAAAVRDSAADRARACPEG